MVVFITANTNKASGELWEIKCAEEENVPIIFLWGNKIHSDSETPNSVPSYKVRPWTWQTIELWIASL